MLLTGLLHPYWWSRGMVSYPPELRALEDLTTSRVSATLEESEGLIEELDYHAFRNVLNQISILLPLLGLSATGEMDLLSDSIGRFESILQRRQYANENWRWMEKSIWDEISHKVPLEHENLKDPKKYDDQLRLLNDILAVLKARIRDLSYREESGDDFVAHNVSRILRDLQEVFVTMARNSQGRYTICFDRGKNRDESEYGMFIEIINDVAEKNHTVSYPVVFSDVFRDMLANARKYSSPGSTIRGRIHEMTDRVVFTVLDAWYGIPEEALPKLGTPGYRADNVRDKIIWHGYGVTKMLYYAKKFWWEVFVRSNEWVGTEFTVIIPKVQNIW